MSIIEKHKPIVFNQLASCPVGSLWLLKLEEIEEQHKYILNPLYKALFPRWISSQHNTIDLTPVFSVRGTKLYKTIIDVLVNGEIYPISHGYVFCLNRNSVEVGMEHVTKTHLVFVNNQDKRLDGIKAMRLLLIDPVLQQAHNLNMPIAIEDLLTTAGLEIEDFSDLQQHNPDFKDEGS